MVAAAVAATVGMEETDEAPAPRAPEDANFRRKAEVTFANAGKNSCGIPIGVAAMVEARLVSFKLILGGANDPTMRICTSAFFTLNHIKHRVQ